MQHGLNIRQIEIFRAIIECKTTVAASERLNISQPTISGHLAALEEATSLTLFERSRNRLVPTPAAEAFYDEIQKVYLGIDHLKRFTDGLRNNFRGQIHFGAMPMVAYGWMPGIIGDFIKQNENVSISMPVRSSRQLLEWTAADRLDFCIVHSIGRYPKLSINKILRLPIVCLFPADSELAAKPSISLSDLSGKNVVKLRSFDVWTTGAEVMLENRPDVVPRNLIETFNTQTAARIAKSCSGFALIDGLTALEEEDQTMIWRPVEEEEYLDIHLVVSKSKPLSDASKALIKAIQSDAEQLQEKLQTICNMTA